MHWRQRYQLLVSLRIMCGLGLVLGSAVLILEKVLFTSLKFEFEI